MITVDFSETIAASDLKGTWSRHLIEHGGKSKGTTCVVDRDVTAYMVVDRVLRFPTE